MARARDTWAPHNKFGCKTDAPRILPFLQACHRQPCPTTSAEYERVFSSLKRTVSPLRCSLSETTIEAGESLASWWKNCSNIEELGIEEPAAPREEMEEETKEEDN